jgi:hypothetical protein
MATIPALQSDGFHSLLPWLNEQQFTQEINRSSGGRGVVLERQL